MLPPALKRLWYKALYHQAVGVDIPAHPKGRTMSLTSHFLKRSVRFQSKSLAISVKRLHPKLSLVLYNFNAHFQSM